MVPPPEEIVNLRGKSPVANALRNKRKRQRKREREKMRQRVGEGGKEGRTQNARAGGG